LLLLYHISPSRLLLFKRLPWPFRTAFNPFLSAFAPLTISVKVFEQPIRKLAFLMFAQVE